jgi:hypothetical protein
MRAHNASWRQGQDGPKNATHRGFDRGVCMKVGTVGFPMAFAIALRFSPQFARRSATRGFDGRHRALPQRIFPTLYFLIMMRFFKNSNFEFS